MKKFSPRTLTQRDLALFFGVEVRTVQRWTDDGCPRNENGTYDSEHVIGWRIDKAQMSSKQALETLKADMADTGGHTERWQKARADKAELDVGERMKDLCRVDDIERKWVLALTALSSVLQTVPSAMAVSLVGATEDEIEEELTKALKGAMERGIAVYEAGDIEEAEEKEPAGV